MRKLIIFVACTFLLTACLAEPAAYSVDENGWIMGEGFSFKVDDFDPIHGYSLVDGELLFKGEKVFEENLRDLFIDDALTSYEGGLHDVNITYNGWHPGESEEDIYITFTIGGGCGGCVNLHPLYLKINEVTGEVEAERADPSLNIFNNRAISNSLSGSRQIVFFVKGDEEGDGRDEIWVYDYTNATEQLVHRFPEGKTLYCLNNMGCLNRGFEWVYRGDFELAIWEEDKDVDVSPESYPSTTYHVDIDTEWRDEFDEPDVVIY